MEQRVFWSCLSLKFAAAIFVQSSVAVRVDVARRGLNDLEKLLRGGNGIWHSPGILNPETCGGAGSCCCWPCQNPLRKSRTTAPFVELAGSVALKRQRSAWSAIAKGPGSRSAGSRCNRRRPQALAAIHRSGRPCSCHPRMGPSICWGRSAMSRVFGSAVMSDRPSPQTGDCSSPSTSPGYRNIVEAQRLPHDANSPSNALASFKSSVSKPSVNQPYTGARSSRASSRLP
jgi:hypothetical protein